MATLIKYNIIDTYYVVDRENKELWIQELDETFQQGLP